MARPCRGTIRGNEMVHPDGCRRLWSENEVDLSRWSVAESSVLSLTASEIKVFD